MTTFPLQSQPADSGSRHLRNLTPTDKALLTRARRNGGGQALRRAVALAYERFGDEIRDAGGIYNVPALRDPETAALLLQRFGSGDQISTGGDTWLTQWNANNIPQTRPGRIDISDVWFEEYVDAISANSNLGSGDLFDDARRVRRRADERESAEQRRIERELIGKALDYRDSLTSRPVPADLQRLEETLKHSAQRVIEATDEGGRRHRRYELDDGSALVFWQHPRRGRTREEVEGVALGTHRSRLALLPSNLRYPALFNGRRDEDAAVPASVREYQSIQYGGQGEGTVDRHHAAPSPDIERDYLTYLQELRRQGRVDVRDPRVSSPGLRVMRVGRDAPPPRDLRPFTVRQAGSDAAEWHNRLGADPNATPDDALQELDDLGAERTVRPDRESVRLAFPDASNALIDMRTGDVRPLEKRARSSAPRGPEPARPEQSFASTNNQDKLPFRFADRDLPAYAHDDPSRATPGINLDPEANRDTLGEYGRLWQSQSGHLEAERLRAEGKPVQADLRTLTADAWLKSNEPGPTDAGRQSARTDARLAAALSSMVSLEGEAQAHIEDWLARLQRNSQEQRAEHYREAERLQTQGRAEQAAIHQHIADRWADPNQGVQREVLEPELASQGWQVVSLDDHKEFFDKRVFRFRDPKSGRFQVWRGFLPTTCPPSTA